jgi:hypothetical protein
VRVFDDLPQLIQDQPRLEFQCGGQCVRDLQKHSLLTRAGFDPLLEMLFRLDALADVPEHAQQARPVLMGESRSAPLGVKCRTIPELVERQRVEYRAGSK